MLSRRDVLAGATAGTAGALLSAQAARRPDIVIFLADDLGCNDLGAWGAADLQTPDGDKALTAEDALFLSNLEEDPAESVNLRRRFPGMVDELATLMRKWTEEVTKW